MHRARPRTLAASAIALAAASLLAAAGTAVAATLTVAGSSTPAAAHTSTAVSAPGPIPGTPAEPPRQTRTPYVAGCSASVLGGCGTGGAPPTTPPPPPVTISWITLPAVPGAIPGTPGTPPRVCAVRTGTAATDSGKGVHCTPTPPSSHHAPGTPPATPPLVWRYGFSGETFTVCVHSWSVTYQGQTLTQTGSPCTGRFRRTFEVGCHGTGRISASFTLAYLSTFPGWDPTVEAAGRRYGLDRVTSLPTPPGFFPDGTTTVSLGSATVVPECPSAGYNTPPATESLYALGPLAAFDTGQPNTVKFEPIVRNGGHLDLPVAWLGFTSFSIGPGTDRLAPGGFEVLDSNPYEASASVDFKPGPTDPTGSIGRIDVSFNTPSIVGAPYVLSATGRFAVWWGTEFVTLSILPNLHYATPVTLRIAGTRPVVRTVCSGSGKQRTCQDVIKQVPTAVAVSFLPLAKHGTLTTTTQALASTTTFDKAHETVFTRSATAKVNVYGPMLNIPTRLGEPGG